MLNITTEEKSPASAGTLTRELPLDNIHFTTIDPWLDCRARWLSSRRSENTQRMYERSLREFAKASEMPLHRATRRDVMTWVESMKSNNMTPATIASRIAAVSSFYNFASNEYLVIGDDGLERPICQQNPAGGCRKVLPKVDKYGKARALSTADCKKLLGQIDISTVIGLRDYALIAGYLILGRRNTEWVTVSIADFEMSDSGKMFLRWSGKGHTNEQLEVPEEMWKALNAYINESGGRGPFDYIFLDRDGNHPISRRRVEDIVKRYARLAGINGNVRVHDLRHTAVALRRAAGADMEEIRDFLKHSSLLTTQVYLHRLERIGDDYGSTVCKAIL